MAGINRQVDQAARDRLGGVSPEGLTHDQLLARYLSAKQIPADRAAILLQCAADLMRPIGGVYESEN